MIIQDGKIVEATEQELFSYYLDRELDEIYSFSEWLSAMEKAGTKIIKEVCMPSQKKRELKEKFICENCIHESVCYWRNAYNKIEKQLLKQKCVYFLSKNNPEKKNYLEAIEENIKSFLNSKKETNIYETEEQERAYILGVVEAIKFLSLFADIKIDNYNKKV